MKIWTCAEFVQCLFSGCSMANRRKGALMTAWSHLMVIKNVPPPPEYPDIAPCNFWLLLKPKKNLRGTCFQSIDKMNEGVSRVLGTFTLDHSHEVFTEWLDGYNNCIEVGGSYFEDQRFFFAFLFNSLKLMSPLKSLKISGTHLVLNEFVRTYSWAKLRRHGKEAILA